MSPLSRYFKGKGQEVLSDMKDRYGAEDGKQAFYATANKQGQTPPESKSKPAKRKSIGQRMVERAGY